MTRRRRDAPPRDLRATEFELGGDTFVVLSYAAEAPTLDVLTGAERQVLGLLLEGLTNAAIARARGTALRTVANQVAAIFAKLGVGSRAELAAALIRPQGRKGRRRKAPTTPPYLIAGYRRPSVAVHGHFVYCLAVTGGLESFSSRAATAASRVGCFCPSGSSRYIASWRSTAARAAARSPSAS